MQGRVKTKQEPIGSMQCRNKNIVVQWALLRLRNGILYRETKRKQTGDIFYQLVVPLSLRNVILEQLHNLRIVGHLGIARTLARVQERYYWPCMATDVARWCAACSDCAAWKGKPPPKRVPLAPLPAQTFWTHIYLRRGEMFTFWLSVTIFRNTLMPIP